MKIIKTVPPALILLLALSFTLQAQSSAGIGAQFLQVSPSPRASAMADAYVSQTRSADAFYYNPASSVFLAGLSLSGSYIRWIGDMNYYSLFVSKRFSRKIAFGAGMIGLNTGGISETIDTGYGDIAATGKSFSALDLCGLLNSSVILFHVFSAGVNLKFISKPLALGKSFAIGADAGIFYYLKNTGLNMGVVVQNFGADVGLASADSQLPLSIKFGGSYKQDLSQFNSFFNSILLAAQVRKTSNESIATSLGIECAVWEMVMLRGGYEYQPESDSSGFKAGIGLNFDQWTRSSSLKGLQINYSLNFFKNLGIAHSFQVNLLFQPTKPKTEDPTITESSK